MKDGVGAGSWQLRFWLAVVFALLAEAQMANNLFYLLHSYFLTSLHNRVNMVFYVFAMILLAMPLLIVRLEIHRLGKEMPGLGLNESAVQGLQRTMGEIAVLCYMAFCCCIGSFSGIVDKIGK